MQWLHPIDIAKEIITGPLMVACYFLITFLAGFGIGKWSASYG